ncbi:DEAD/DEAH box helicase family protein [Candidatus Woesearchaeota archaeon]|nr:DEAD/DEAH box helicase family protein [Candidatus Woesearchaeota archaeon]
MAKTKESDFEEAIVDSLVNSGGYEEGDPKDFDSETAIFKNDLFNFLQKTQPNEWKKSLEVHGNDVEEKVLFRLTQELQSRDILDVLRNGFTDYGVKYKLAFFKPETKLNLDDAKRYKNNLLKVTRQVHHSPNNPDLSLDLVLSINGIPVATAELKNQFTGQNVSNAERQYIEDRDPNELIFQFKRRTLVHFAIDTDEVFMTTKLEGKRTRYLPFNQGDNNGAGNPLNPDGYKTAYLWEYVWSKDSWMDILQKFVHLQTETYKIEGKTIKKEKMIFPRYHQLDSVRKLTQDVKSKGAGINYLIQHSAGSGKSNSIAWLAYRLASLHNKEDKAVFNSVIVVTDRTVLDKQLQDTIYQFEHKQGVVQKIDKNSTQLAESLTKGIPIIITTLQKFPFVLDKIGKLPKRKYAVIVDEAHSSQGGESSKKMKEVLSIKDSEKALNTLTEEAEDLAEDEIRKSMEARGKQDNLSFFAFTATPKNKTLEVFGHKKNKKPYPFHLYSMRQAIEEGFIIDILKNFTTYKTYFKLSKEIEDDPKINKKKAARAIARFLTLHPHNLSQKTEVMVEHFRQVVMHKIGGKAKAMVVTASRLHAVRYYQEFNKYIKEKGYSNIKTLVAFSGIVKDEFGNEFKETIMNGFKEKELPDKFNTSEYQILLVAEKYQTGFDQPLLHTMYVDKKLSGVKAVQTLSRLNRVCSGKEDTFILDFANTEEEIIESFQPYYEITTIDEPTNPNRLYDLKTKLDQTRVYTNSEIDSFAKFFFKPKERYTVRDNAQLNRFIDPAVDRYKGISGEDDKEDFKHTLTVFIRTYAFLAQIMPFNDAELEKLFAYGKLLLNKLPKRQLGEQFKLNDEVALEYYRLQKIKESHIKLEKGKVGELNSAKEAGIRKDKEEKAKLSELIEVLNDRFGTDFTEADKLFFDQIEAELVEDQKLKSSAEVNNIENFKFGFDDQFMNKLIDRMEQNEDIFRKINDDKVFASVVKDYMLKKVYNRLKEEEKTLSKYLTQDGSAMAVADKKEKYGKKKVKK